MSEFIPTITLSEVIDKVRTFSSIANLSKHEQVVKGVITAIEDQVVERGQILPSINKMSNELGFARKTIDKAYRELKDRGLVESRNRKGFFVSTESTDQTVRVALVLYEFRPFQEKFYNVFRGSLGANVQVDTFFHHNDLSTFEDIVVKVTGHYGLYVVAPIVHQSVPTILEPLNDSRLLLIDRFVKMTKQQAFVVQEFEHSTREIFEGMVKRLERYDRLELFFRTDAAAAYPPEILLALRSVCQRFNLRLVVKEQYESGSLEKGVLYLTIGDNDLWSLLEDCIDRGYTLGEEVGVLSHNESRIKKIVHGGVSTWSTDFSQMAKLAAHFVLNRESAKITLPTKFIDRNSF